MSKQLQDATQNHHETAKHHLPRPSRITTPKPPPPDVAATCGNRRVVGIHHRYHQTHTPMKFNPDKLTRAHLGTVAQRLRIAANQFERLSLGDKTPEETAIESAAILIDLADCCQRDLGSSTDPTPAEIGGELERMVERIHDSWGSYREMTERVADLEEYAETLKNL